MVTLIKKFADGKIYRSITLDQEVMDEMIIRGFPNRESLEKYFANINYLLGYDPTFPGEFHLIENIEQQHHQEIPILYGEDFQQTKGYLLSYHYDIDEEEYNELIDNASQQILEKGEDWLIKNFRTIYQTIEENHQTLRRNPCKRKQLNSFASSPNSFV